MADDVLNKLKADLEEQEAIMANAKTAVRDLKLAIAAILQSRGVACPDSAPSSPKNLRRGVLKRAILDCLQSGVGARGKLEDALRERGIETSGNSISNALYRMQSRKEIRWDNARQVYFIPEKEKTSVCSTEASRTNGAAHTSA